MSFISEGPVATLEAAADLSAKQYYIVDCTAAKKVNLAGDGAVCIGVLENEPESGEAASVRIYGIAQVSAGAAISAGALVASDANGQAVTATTGEFSIGVALEAAGAQNDIIAIKLSTAYAP